MVRSENVQAGADRERARNDRPSRTCRYGDRGSEDVSREMPGQRSRSRRGYPDGLLAVQRYNWCCVYFFGLCVAPDSGVIKAVQHARGKALIGDGYDGVRSRISARSSVAFAGRRSALAPEGRDASARPSEHAPPARRAAGVSERPRESDARHQRAITPPDPI